MKTLLRCVAAAAVLGSLAAAAQDAGVDAPAAAPVTPPMSIDPAPPKTEDAPAAAAEAAPPMHWWEHVRPFGYAKAGVFYTFPAQDDQLVGSNGGFRLAALRLGAEITLVENLSVTASLETSARRPSADDPTVGVRFVDLRDAYVDWKICPGAQIRIGQFKAPFWAETLIGDESLPFISRSPVAEGVTSPEGFGPQSNLTLDRQIGLQIASDRLGSEDVGFRYAVALVNGNGANQLFNDNNIVAPVGRVELELMKMITVGANGYFNVKTDGIRTNRLNVSQIGYGADVQAKVRGLTALVGLVGRSSNYGGSLLPPESALGVVAQVHDVWAKYGVEGGVRFTYFEPSSTQVDDQFIEVAAMVGYRFTKWPVRVILQYTHREEAKAVAIPNDSLDAMLQVAW